MKNIKNTIATMGLVAVLGLGATTANAGLMVSDAPMPEVQAECTDKGGFFQTMSGALIQGINGLLLSDGLIITDGLIISDAPAKCNAKGGLIVSDGLVVSD